MNQRTFFNLSAITGRIQEILQPYIGKQFWVRAEISSAEYNTKRRTEACTLVEFYLFP
jgi:hypothetical protein